MMNDAAKAKALRNIADWLSQHFVHASRDEIEFVVETLNKEAKRFEQYRRV
jgi:hypothetical protein